MNKLKTKLFVLLFCKAKKKFIFGSAAAALITFVALNSSAYPPVFTINRGRIRDVDVSLLGTEDADSERHMSVKKQFDFLNPPGLNHSEYRSSYTSNTLELQSLSEIVQSQIRSLQDSTNCAKGAIICGHADNYCGFGCHIHHRAACLMISYAMGLPLIHETEIDGGNWTFSTPWTEVLLPLGSACNVTSSTYKWTWSHWAGYYSKSHNFSEFAWNRNHSMQPDKVGFPLFDGIVAASPLAEMVEKLHPNPFLWWASQFVQYTMQVQPKTMNRIRKEQASIGLEDDCIGLHVRRTDKIGEANDSFHELDEYFSKVKEVTEKVFMENGGKPQVFIASEDSSVLSLSKDKYKDREVVGFVSNQTLKSPSQRKNYLYEVLRDTLSLARCSTVICGLSSNICRLLLEMQTGSQRRLISLERTYTYSVLGTAIKTSINKLSSKLIHQIDRKEVV